MSKSYQEQTRRKLRRLEEKQKWGIKVGKRGSWLFAPQYPAYLKALVAANERIWTFVLSLDGIPSAVKVIVAGPILCTLIIGAYDEDQSYCSPGSILDEYWIKYVCDSYCDTESRKLNVNFGVGLERYKMHWSRGHALDTASYKVAASAWGEIPYRLERALKTLKRRAARPPVPDAI